MTLDEIRLLLCFKDSPAENCGGVNDLLDEHIGHVASRIRELHQLEQQLKSLRELCQDASDAGSCGILNQLTQSDTSKPRALAISHVSKAHSTGRR